MSELRVVLIGSAKPMPGVWNRVVIEPPHCTDSFARAEVYDLYVPREGEEEKPRRLLATMDDVWLVTVAEPLDASDLISVADALEKVRDRQENPECY